jgi:hypothetical protein
LGNTIFKIFDATVTNSKPRTILVIAIEILFLGIWDKSPVVRCKPIVFVLLVRFEGEYRLVFN